MTIQKTISQTREGFENLLDQVTNNREVVVIHRHDDCDDVAMISASELESLMETAYLMRTSPDAERMLVTMERVLKDNADTQTIGDMQRAVFAS